MESSFFSYLSLAIVGLLGIPVAVFFVEVVAAVAMRWRHPVTDLDTGRFPRVAVLVPAHDEGAGLLPTIRDVKEQLRPGDRIVVVADNCSDDTAAVASKAGAEVIERNDRERFGKGYALDHGVRFLAADPSDLVIVVDADCRLAAGFVDRLAAACASSGRPVQALDLMIRPDPSQDAQRFAEFAWRVKNWVRPVGLKALGLPSQLMGTGMIFPWHIIRTAPLASGHIVEDLKLGLELALAGSPPLFCPEAIITSEFPRSELGRESQRLRWGRGHLGMILTEAPRYFVLALARRNWPLLALTFDITVPPLSLLGLLVFGSWAITGLATLLGFPPAAFVASTISLSVFAFSIMLSWLAYGRDVVPLRAFWATGWELLGRFRLYRRLLSLRGSHLRWTRTDRTDAGPTARNDFDPK